MDLEDLTIYNQVDDIISQGVYSIKNDDEKYIDGANGRERTAKIVAEHRSENQFDDNVEVINGSELHNYEVQVFEHIEIDLNKAAVKTHHQENRTKPLNQSNVMSTLFHPYSEEHYKALLAGYNGPGRGSCEVIAKKLQGYNIRLLDILMHIMIHRTSDHKECDAYNKVFGSCEKAGTDPVVADCFEDIMGYNYDEHNNTFGTMSNKLYENEDVSNNLVIFPQFNVDHKTLKAHVKNICQNFEINANISLKENQGYLCEQLSGVRNIVTNTVIHSIVTGWTYAKGVVAKLTKERNLTHSITRNPKKRSNHVALVNPRRKVPHELCGQNCIEKDDQCGIRVTTLMFYLWLGTISGNLLLDTVEALIVTLYCDNETEDMDLVDVLYIIKVYGQAYSSSAIAITWLIRYWIPLQEVEIDESWDKDYLKSVYNFYRKHDLTTSFGNASITDGLGIAYNTRNVVDFTHQTKRCKYIIAMLENQIQCNDWFSILNDDVRAVTNQYIIFQEKNIPFKYHLATILADILQCMVYHNEDMNKYEEMNVRAQLGCLMFHIFDPRYCVLFNTLPVSENEKLIDDVSELIANRPCECVNMSMTKDAIKSKLIEILLGEMDKSIVLQEHIEKLVDQEIAILITRMIDPLVSFDEYIDAYCEFCVKFYNVEGGTETRVKLSNILTSWLLFSGGNKVLGYAAFVDAHWK